MSAVIGSSASVPLRGPTSHYLNLLWTCRKAIEQLNTYNNEFVTYRPVFKVAIPLSMKFTSLILMVQELLAPSPVIRLHKDRFRFLAGPPPWLTLLEDLARSLAVGAQHVQV